MDQIEQFIRDSGLDIPAYSVCFYDSNGTDEILDSIISGKKHANTGLYSLFQAQMQPRCITRTVKVEIIPFAEVTQDCALAEGDGTLAQWREVHRKAFETACAEIGTTFDESMKCVCEYFEVVYQAQG